MVRHTTSQAAMHDVCAGTDPREYYAHAVVAEEKERPDEWINREVDMRMNTKHIVRHFTLPNDLIYFSVCALRTFLLGICSFQHFRL